MKTHMQREINVLRNQLLELGGDVNSSLNMTYKALLDMDKSLANKVIKADKKINWICNRRNKSRVFHGKTSSGRKGRGLRKA